MNPLKKIAGINLAIIFVYSVLIRAVSGGGSGKAMSIAILSAFAVGIHVVICLIVAGVMSGNKTPGLGRAWLLSSGIVLLVGFSTCLGNASL